MAERVLIDGRSGSGKTELASSVVSAWPSAQLVRLDDIYPGWDGLDAGSAAVADILTSHQWREWDWAHSAPGGLHDLDPARPIVIEGVGALSRASRALASLAVWVEIDDDTERRRRALARDPAQNYEANWIRWSRQEDAFIARERPSELADVVVDGTDVRAATARILALVS